MTLHAYTLTAITGRKASQRRTVTFATIDWQPRVLMIVGLSLAPAMVAAVILWALSPIISVLSFVGTVAGSLWLFMVRTKDSRDSTRFQEFRDNTKAKRELGRFFIAGHEIDPAQADSLELRTTTSHPSATPSAKEQPW